MVKASRERNGLTQEALARKVGLTKPSIAMLESGARKNPSLLILQRLAKALKVKLPELLK